MRAYGLLVALAATLVSAVGCGDGRLDPDLDVDAADEETGTTTAALEASWPLSCKSVNDFGYVAEVTGNLQPTAGPNGSVSLTGLLEIRVGAYGSAMRLYRRARVEGTGDAGFHYANLTVTGGARALESLNVTTQGGAASSVNGKNGTGYQTDCTRTSTDLTPAGTLAVYDFQDSQGVAVDVYNVGSRPIQGQVMVRVGGTTVSGTVFPYDVALGADPFVLLPGTRGNVSVQLPRYTLARCSEYAVTVDPARTLQAGVPSPFVDDTATAKTSCLTFTTPITLQAVGFSPEPILRGHTLEEMINSRFVARTKDKQLCATCHYATANNAYHPPVARHIPKACTTDVECPGAACVDSQCTYAGSTSLGPLHVIDDPRLANTGHPFRSWAGGASNAGWAALFNTHDIPDRADSKPEYLQKIMRRWLDDGAR